MSTYILCISSPIFIISLLLITLDLLALLFLISLDGAEFVYLKLFLFLEICLYGYKLLWMTFAPSHRSWKAIFPFLSILLLFLIVILIPSLTYCFLIICWFVSRYLYFCYFSLSNKLCFIPMWLERMLDNIYSFNFVETFFIHPPCDPYWRLLYVHLNRMCILLLLDGMSRFQQVQLVIYAI